MAVANNLSDRRAAPRFDIVAQARVISARGAHVLSVRNVSASGAFLEGRPREHADLVPGVEIEVSLSATVPGSAEDEMINIDEVINIECRGRVARIQFSTPTSPSGFGITLVPKTDGDQERLEDLLSRLIALPANRRSVNLG
jgi:PilZ domain